MNTAAKPAFRRLRVYAFDPSLNTQIETAVVNQMTLNVPWETAPSAPFQNRKPQKQLGPPSEDFLKPGPVGEYLEVVDYDPASNCFYDPIDLNSPFLLAQDGLAPSEGNPQFHQQMVYAVAMTTIKHFEQSLGRQALWSPRKYDSKQPKLDLYVGRLRIYPHAMREANAYYSPAKKALLFGYFPASFTDPGGNLPGGTVFTCLSHDVVAHETTHALLDGMHRYFDEPTNPDVLAFHEAFADIVALFQHFTFPDVLRHQIAKTRGDLAAQNLLGQLAQQFGQAIGMRGALRDAIGGVDEKTGKWTAKEPDPIEYQRAAEPHARGAILVAAVFDAFLSIYKSRIADLLRIATGGTGVLPTGEIHPDLVNRLAGEAAKSAQHILRMCIRALDYCPPVDITFGEFLRAIVTADFDLVRDDDRGYRIAFIEAFRRRGIYPPSVRSLAVDSLRWREPDDDEQQIFQHVLYQKGLDLLQQMAERWSLDGNRRDAYANMKTSGSILHDSLKLRATGDKRAGELMGLDFSKSRPFYIYAIRPARRIGPDGQFIRELVIEILQRRRGAFDPAQQAAADAQQTADDANHAKKEGQPAKSSEPDFWYRGGCTLLINAETGKVRYCIKKDIKDDGRLSRQRAYQGSPDEVSLRVTYFGRPVECEEPFALLHRGLESPSISS